MARSTSSPVAASGTATGAVPGRRLALHLLFSLRPGQWTKNLVIFAGLLFGRRLFDADAVLADVAAFVVFCVLSGVVYLINDVADREADRLHPLKRHRPIASGAVAPGVAIGAALVLTVAALGGAWLLRPAFAAIAAFYVGLLALYSGPLKHV